ncbi:methionine ABC transporter ATP-binding protein [Clostridium polynesiense]|uniref:methionine ABC transporter ATP-binding protein n=1 Tax=Clostridium polynesiense TaxID=1325933 RepID=UPI00058E2090|nr:methionine ABC transporter ATP-binding protein [Clostridium polynesiense]
MIEINGLYKNYYDYEVLKDISMEIKEGEIFGIIGRSGAGKSTLLRCINGLEPYDKGSVKVMGKEISTQKNMELRALRKDLGMIFQSFNLLERKSVYDNVALPMEIWGEGKSKIDARVKELLKLVGLEDKAEVKPKSLSGGQKQRVAIARALSLNPKVLLCDEATSALDPSITKGILNLLQDINKKLGITIIVVTHQMEVVKEICERVALLEDGRLMALGNSNELFLKPNNELKKFLGEEEILPGKGVNIRIFFPKELSQQSIITAMARELDIDFSIVWGKLEKFRSDVLGSLVINLEKENEGRVLNYLIERSINWEVI